MRWYLLPKALLWLKRRIYKQLTVIQAELNMYRREVKIMAQRGKWYLCPSGSRKLSRGVDRRAFLWGITDIFRSKLRKGKHFNLSNTACIMTKKILLYLRKSRLWVRLEAEFGPRDELPNAVAACGHWTTEICYKYKIYAIFYFKAFMSKNNLICFNNFYAY